MDNDSVSIHRADSQFRTMDVGIRYFPDPPGIDSAVGANCVRPQNFSFAGCRGRVSRPWEAERLPYGVCCEMLRIRRKPMQKGHLVPPDVRCTPLR